MGDPGLFAVGRARAGTKVEAVRLQLPSRILRKLVLGRQSAVSKGRASFLDLDSGPIKRSDELRDFRTHA